MNQTDFFLTKRNNNTCFFRLDDTRLKYFVFEFCRQLVKKRKEDFCLSTGSESWQIQRIFEKPSSRLGLLCTEDNCIHGYIAALQTRSNTKMWIIMKVSAPQIIEQFLFYLSYHAVLSMQLNRKLLEPISTNYCPELSCSMYRLDTWNNIKKMLYILH